MARRIIFPEKGKVVCESFDVRDPKADEIRVRTLHSLISIGTETTILHAKYDAGTHFAQRFSFPQLKTGVQSVAVVEAVGADVVEFAPGDRMFMRYGHVSHWTLPAAACSPAPADLDSGVACWCGLAKTAFRAAYAGPFSLGGEALVVGAGPVGQMALRWAACAGMGKLVAADLSGLRLGLAERGAGAICVQGALDEVGDQLLAHCDNQGFDLVVDTTGNPEVFAQALALMAPYGKLVLLGDTGFPGEQRLASEVMTKGLTIVATHDHQDRGGWTQRRIDALFFKLVQSGAFRLDRLITHQFAPADCADAYDLASNRREEAAGILFDWTAG